MRENEKKIYLHNIKEILKNKKINFFFYAKENIFLIPQEEQTKALLEVYLYQEKYIDELRRENYELKNKEGPK